MLGRVATEELSCSCSVAFFRHRERRTHDSGLLAELVRHPEVPMMHCSHHKGYDTQCFAANAHTVLLPYSQPSRVCAEL